MKVGRNQPCPCGSGRKFKRCCMKDTGQVQETLFEPELALEEWEQGDSIALAAHALAAMVAKTGNTALDDETRDFLADSPECLLVFLDGFLEAANRLPGEEGEELADAYYFLLDIELGFLRFHLDQNHDWAHQIREDFERRFIDAIESREASGAQAAAVVNAMIEKQLQPSAELAAVCEESFEDEEPGDIDPAALCAEIAAQCHDDPFMIREVLYSSKHFTDDASSAAAIQALMKAPQSGMREGAALGVLDADSDVRRAVAKALTEVPETITPPTLRRLIALRRWLPEAERAPIDQAVRAARLAGVECAQWPPGARIAEIRASAPDGSGAQMAMIVTEADGEHRLSALLFKHGGGIGDAWTSAPQPMREIKEMLSEQSSGIRLLPVSRAYLDRMAGYYLNLAVKESVPPPARLLEVAEFVQAPQWQPAECGGWREMLAGLMTEVRSELLAPNSVRQIIATSAKWGMRRQWAESWAEEGEEVEDLFDRYGHRSWQFICDAIVDQILEKHRATWTERFTLTALWMKEAPRASLPWEHFAIVAHSMLNEIPLRNFPLMHKIAKATACF